MYYLRKKLESLATSRQADKAPEVCNDEDGSQPQETQYFTPPASPPLRPSLDENNQSLEQESVDKGVVTNQTISATPKPQPNPDILDSSLEPLTANAVPPPQPPRSGRKRPSLTPGLGPNQCLEMNKDGKQCSRTSSSSEYCYQHVRKAKSKIEIFQLPSGRNLEDLVADLIPSYLSNATRTNIIECIKRPLLLNDEPGFIYAFKILDFSDSENIYIKVGRGKDVKQRRQDRANKCGFTLKEMGRWPPEQDDKTQTNKIAKYSHILEDLMLLEVRDVAMNSLHLLRGYPCSIEEPPVPSGANLKNRYHCGTCNTGNREIFRFKRGSLKEWEEVLCPKYEKLGRFVESHF